MSIMGTAIFQPASNFSVVRCGMPLSIREMSVLVPPISKPMTFDRPHLLPIERRPTHATCWLR